MYIYTHHISIYIQIIHINMLEAGMCACRRAIPSEDLRATISLPRAHPGISSIKLKRAYAVITSFCMWSGDHLESLYRHRRPPRTFPPTTAPSQRPAVPAYPPCRLIYYIMCIIYAPADLGHNCWHDVRKNNQNVK